MKFCHLILPGLAAEVVFCVFKKKINRGRHYDFWRPAGEMARAHILWSHRVDKPQPLGHSAGEFSIV